MIIEQVKSIPFIRAILPRNKLFREQREGREQSTLSIPFGRKMEISWKVEGKKSFRSIRHIITANFKLN